MIVRCNGTSIKNEAIKAAMRIRMRMAGLCDHTYWWQSSHPDNPKCDPERILTWIHQQWKQVQHIDPSVMVGKEDFDNFDDEVAEFRLFYVPEWPTDKIIGKGIRVDGSQRAAPRWFARLEASVVKHGILDPLLAYNHVPTQTIVGWDPGTPICVLGNNRVAVAQKLGLKTLPLVVSFPRDQVPKYAHERVSFEELHNEILNHRGDLWVTPQEWALVHPPTMFHDEHDGRDHEFDHA